MERMLRCRPATEHDRRYFGEFRILPESKAREMAAIGEVEIDGETPPRQEPPAAIRGPVEYLRRAKFQQRERRVAWVQDMSKMGGAELSNCTVVDAGRDRGFDIVGVTPGNFRVDVLTQADIIIVNNCMEFQADQLRDIQYVLYERRARWVKYEHDYRELRRQNISRPLFERSFLNVFISPAHRDRFAAEMHVEGIALPLAVDTAQYEPVPGVVRDAEAVLWPVPKKGTKQVFEWVKRNPQRRVTVMGPLGQPFPAGKHDYIPKTAPANMPEIYSGFGTVIHLPDTHWAGDRVLFEAVLCGCDVITNANAGHESWKAVFDWRDPAKLKSEMDKAKITFWNEIDKCLDTSLY